MAISKYGADDWMAGWRVAIDTGEGWVNGAVLTDSTGVELGTAGNPLNVNAGGSPSAVISAVNSSATPLGVGAVFTGTAVNTLAYGSLAVTVFSDVASAAQGLSVQQSSNGTNWDITDTFTVSAGVSTKVVIPRQATFARIVYTNGGTIQASFRLQTILSPTMPTASAVKPIDATSLENDFAASMSVGMLSNGTTADVQRSAVNATNSTGTGITAAALIAQLDDTTPTTITENSFGNLRMAPNRALLARPYASSADDWSYPAATGGITNTTTAVTIKAAVAGLKNYITGIDFSTDIALGAATELAIRNGAAGTVIWRTKIGTTGQIQGRSITFPNPITSSTNTLLEVVTLTASITGSVFFNATGYTAP